MRENGTKGAIFISKTIGIIAMLSILHGTALAQNHPLPITYVSISGNGTVMNVGYNDQGDTRSRILYCWYGTYNDQVNNFFAMYGFVNLPGSPRNTEIPSFNGFAPDWQSTSYECSIEGWVVDEDGNERWGFIALVQFYKGWDRAIVYHRYGPHYYIPVNYIGFNGYIGSGYTSTDPGYPCYDH